MEVALGNNLANCSLYGCIDLNYSGLANSTALFDNFQGISATATLCQNMSSACSVRNGGGQVKARTHTETHKPAVVNQVDYER